MAECHTVNYELTDGSIVTTKMVADKVGISESAARNRLIRHRNPVKIYEKRPVKARKPKVKKEEKTKVLKIDDPMFILAFGGEKAYKKAIGKKNA